MAVNRTSTSLVRFLGTQLSAEISRAQFSNVFRSGQSTERTITPSVIRLTSGNLVPAAINIDEFYAAAAFLESRGISQLVAQAMAVVFVDVAKNQNVGVMRLLDSADSESISLVRKEVYQIINQLRDSTSQLSNAPAAQNANSLVNRQLKPYA
jgi:hypothetical protein